MGKYGTSDKEASELSYFATEISARFQKSVFDVGRCLIRAKELLKHGEYMDWVASELGMSPRTAQLYVAATKRFGDDPAMQFMPPYVLKDLSNKSVSDELVAQVVEKFRAGEALSSRQLQKLIQAAARSEDEFTDDEAAIVDCAACEIASASTAAMFHIGNELWAVEQKLGTRKFVSWVEDHTFLSERLARKYILATAMFEDRPQMHVYSHEVLLELAAVGAKPELVEKVRALGRRLGKQLSVADIAPLLGGK